MKLSEIKDCFDNNKFKIINITKCKNYEFDKVGKEKKFYTEDLKEKEIKLFFKKLEQFIKNTKTLCFIVLNEYFFSYHSVIADDNYKLIMEKANS